MKQYFEKIKTVESAGLKPSSNLDKGAAGRFVKHALSGNEKYDRERAEQTEREKAGAKRKFEDMTERVIRAPIPKDKASVDTVSESCKELLDML